MDHLLRTPHTSVGPSGEGSFGLARTLKRDLPSFGPIYSILSNYSLLISSRFLVLLRDGPPHATGARRRHPPRRAGARSRGAGPGVRRPRPRGRDGHADPLRARHPRARAPPPPRRGWAD